MKIKSTLSNFLSSDRRFSSIVKRRFNTFPKGGERRDESSRQQLEKNIFEKKLKNATSLENKIYLSNFLSSDRAPSREGLTHFQKEGKGEMNLLDNNWKENIFKKKLRNERTSLENKIYLSNFLSSDRRLSS